MKKTRCLNFENGENTNQFNKAEKQTFQKKKQPKKYIYIKTNKNEKHLHLLDPRSSLGHVTIWEMSYLYSHCSFLKKYF